MTLEPADGRISDVRGAPRDTAPPIQPRSYIVEDAGYAAVDPRPA